MHATPFTAAHPAGPLALGQANPLLSGQVFAPRAFVPFAPTGGSASDVIAARVFGPRGTGGGISDGDKGDITVSGGGSTLTIDPSAVTTSKIANDAVITAKIADGNVSMAKLAGLNGLTLQDSDYADALAGYDASGSANARFLVERILALQPTIPGGRLTLTSATPVTAADVTAASTLYYTPWHHNRVTLWDGTRWVTSTFTEVSASLGALTTDAVYDVFGFLSSGVLAIETLVWTSATTRATALVNTTEGRYYKSGDKSRLYLGTLRIDAGAGTCEDSKAKRHLWNMYNRVPRHLYVVDTTDSWNYTTLTWRSANASTANRVLFVRGLDEDTISATATAATSNATATAVNTGVCLDNTNANHAQVYPGSSALSVPTSFASEYRACPGIGGHFLQWVEISNNTGTTTWYGDQGLTYKQTGLVAEGLF